MSSINFCRLAYRRSMRPQTFHTMPTSPAIRSLSQTTPRSLPKKYDQDRDSINTESGENTKSSTDNAAAQDKAAFDPSNTSPEGEMESASGGDKGSGGPLEVSGANKDVSKQQDPAKGGAEKSPKEEKGGSQSGAGSPKKGQATA